MGKDVQDLRVALESRSLTFSGRVGDVAYEFSLELFAAIRKEESRWSTRSVTQFFLKKEAEGTWARLATQRAPWIKVDWTRWDSESEEEHKGGFDTAGMGDFAASFDEELDPGLDTDDEGAYVRP